MLRFKTIAWVTATLVVSAAVSVSAASKVTICHIPPGNPGNAHTIAVGEPAVAAHVANHGDTLGACETDNHPPEADAGEDQCLLLGDEAKLDGSGSSDQDGDPLTFSWELTRKPDGSTQTLSGADTVSPTFTPDRLGEFRARLTVSDGELTDDDSVSVFVTMQPTLDADTYTVRVLESTKVTVSLDRAAPADVVIEVEVDDESATVSLTPLGEAVDEVTVPDGSNQESFWLNGITQGTTRLTVTVGSEECSRSDDAEVVVERLDLQTLADALDQDLAQLEADLGSLLDYATEVQPEFVDSALWKAIVAGLDELEDAIQDALDALFASG